MNPSDSTSLIESPHPPPLRWRGFGKNGDRGRWPMRVKTSVRQNWPGQIDVENREENKFRGKGWKYNVFTLPWRWMIDPHRRKTPRVWIVVGYGCLIIEKCTRMDVRGEGKRGWAKNEDGSGDGTHGRKSGIDIWFRIDPMEKLLERKIGESFEGVFLLINI